MTSQVQLNLRSTDRTGIFGQPDVGKTTLTRYLASLVPENKLLIWDPLDQYHQFPDSCRHVPEDADPEAEFDQKCKELMARGNVNFFVEEAQLYLPEGYGIGPNTRRLLNRGRNYGIGMTVCSQRIQDITKKFFDLAQNVIFFRCGFQARGYISNMVPKPVAQRIFSLPDHHFLHYNLRTENWGVATLKFPQNRVPESGRHQAARVEAVE